MVEEVEFDRRVREIINLLVKKRDFPDVCNIYTESETKSRNLLNYFNLLYWKRPTHLLLGEAPGEKGCALTGIPFTSEQVIRSRKHGSFFQGTIIVEGRQRERSSTVFWDSVSILGRAVVAWNIFPLHPRNNREPRREEIEWGKTMLPLVVNLFPGIKVVSVGNPARTACRNLGIETVGHLTHPVIAHKFKSEIAELFACR